MDASTREFNFTPDVVASSILRDLKDPFHNDEDGLVLWTFPTPPLIAELIHTSASEALSAAVLQGFNSLYAELAGFAEPNTGDLTLRNWLASFNFRGDLEALLRMDYRLSGATGLRFGSGDAELLLVGVLKANVSNGLLLDLSLRIRDVSNPSVSLAQSSEAFAGTVTGSSEESAALASAACWTGFYNGGDGLTIWQSPLLHEYLGLPVVEQPYDIRQLSSHVHPDDIDMARGYLGALGPLPRWSEFTLRVQEDPNESRSFKCFVHSKLDSEGQLSAQRGLIVPLSPSTSIEEHAIVDVSSESKPPIVAKKLLELSDVIGRVIKEGWIIWDEQRRIRDWSDGAERILGYQRDEMLDRSISIISEWENASSGRLNKESLDKWLADHGEDVEEVCLRHRDGREIYCESSMSGIHDDNGNIVLVIEVLRDVTKRRSIERSLSVKLDEAILSSQSKSRFLWSISHEMRTPLNAVLGFAQLLDRLEPPLPVQASSYLSHIQNSGEYMRKLLSDVLDLAKIESGELPFDSSDINCRELCEECLSLVASDADARGITTGLAVSTDRQISADYTRVKQVLLNLLNNGIKYNREHGYLQILVLEKSAGQVHIDVIDSGEGIAEDQLEAIFEPLNRGGRIDSNTESSGLGLAITQALVQGMGGRMGVDSREGQGSTFWLELPGVKSASRTEDSVTLEDPHVGRG